MEEYKPYWEPGATIDDITTPRAKARATATPKGKPGRSKKNPDTPNAGSTGGAKELTSRKDSASGAFDRDKNLVPRVKPAKRGTITVEPGSDAGDSELRVERILPQPGKSDVHLRVVNEKNRTNPDINLDGKIWEIKSPQRGTERTIEKQLKRARKQSSRLILDLSRCGVQDEEAIRQSERRFFVTPGFSKMIIIDKKEKVSIYITVDMVFFR